MSANAQQVTNPRVGARDRLPELGEEATKSEKKMFSFLASCMPGIGELKDIAEIITGKDLVTKEDLSLRERALTAVGLFVPVAGGSAVRQLAEGGIAYGLLKNSGEIEQAASGIGRVGSKEAVKGGLQTINTANLNVIETRTAEIANDEWFSRGYDKPPYSSDCEVKIVQAENENFVRVFSYNADGTSNKLGAWIMRKNDVEGLTPTQIADKYALPKEPTHVCDVIVKPELKLQTGIANKVDEWGQGGGQQFDTMGKRLPQSCFVNEKLIGEQP